MIRQLENLPANVLGFDYTGEVTGTDYETVIIPSIEKAAKDKQKIRLLIRFDESFDSMTFKAMMDDAQVGLKYISDWERIAIVSNHNTINHIIHAFSFLVPGKIKIYPLLMIDEATAWVAGNN